MKFTIGLFKIFRTINTERIRAGGTVSDITYHLMNALLKLARLEMVEDTTGAFMALIWLILKKVTSDVAKQGFGLNTINHQRIQRIQNQKKINKTLS